MENKKTLEDALAEMEANKKQLADFRDKHAQEFEAKNAKRVALNAIVAALSQADRREVLDKHISAAPKPTTPLDIKPPKCHKFDTDVKGPPNWKHWLTVETEIWQALLLSLNIEPPGNGWLFD